jgi:two-component system, sensor histidine kinase and response regulator
MNTYPSRDNDDDRRSPRRRVAVAPADGDGSEMRYRELADNAHDLIYGIDRTGHVSFHNAMSARMLGAADESFVGRHYLDLVDERDRDRVNRFYLRQMARKIPNTYLEFLAATADGSELWLGQNVQLIIEDGELAGFHAVARDISERRRVELALRDSEERFRSSFDNAPIGMALVSTSGRFIRVNPALCDIVGYDEEELLAIDFQQITHPDDIDSDLEQVRRMMDGEARSYQLEKRYIHRDGHAIWIQLSVSVVRDDRQRPLYFVSQIQNIQERRAMLEEVARSRDIALETSRLKSAFLATMSHEVRTPMNGILGVTALMMETAMTDEQAGYMRLIKESAESLFGVLNDVLDIAKLEAGRMPVAIDEIDIRAIVDEVIAAYHAAASAKHLDLSSVVYRGVPDRIVGDGERIRQVLTNLVSNAVKFTEEGDIMVRVRRDEDRLGRAEIRFEIVDTGIGIDPEDVPRLFDQFTQADESSTRRYGGAGLGLAISQRLVQLMSGTIGVDCSQARGSTFWFSLPIGMPGTTNGSAPIPAHTPPQDVIADAPAFDHPHERLRVLVVEDNPINRMVTLGQLRHHSLEADVAIDGWAALDALSRNSYDLILMDCEMPGLDGFGATEMIRRCEAPEEHVVIVAVTAHAMPGARERCLASGMDEYMSKPVASEEITSIIDRFSELRRAGRARTIAAPMEPTLDLRALDRIELQSDRREAFVEEMVSSFVRGGGGRIAQLTSALERNDADEVRRLAQLLSGPARSVGARRLARLLGELENWLPERRIEGARFLARSVRLAFESTASVLQRATRSQSPVRPQA